MIPTMPAGAWRIAARPVPHRMDAIDMAVSGSVPGPWPFAFEHPHTLTTLAAPLAVIQAIFTSQQVQSEITLVIPQPFNIQDLDFLAMHGNHPFFRELVHDAGQCFR